MYVFRQFLLAICCDHGADFFVFNGYFDGHFKFYARRPPKVTFDLLGMFFVNLTYMCLLSRRIKNVTKCTIASDISIFQPHYNQIIVIGDLNMKICKCLVPN